jgi:hypothetical protein
MHGNGLAVAVSAFAEWIYARLRRYAVGVRPVDL